MNKERIEEKLIEFFKSHSDHAPERDENLFDAGVLDSFGIVEFLSFIEQEFGEGIEIEDITMENFSTIGRIRSLIEEMS